MAVAPSFQSYEFLSEPYLKGNKNYIDVRNPKTGNSRTVRWYSQQEYDKAYPQKLAAPNLKSARGFDNGPILVIRNNKTEADEEYLQNSIARYAEGMGWYIVSTDPIPADLPSHFKLLLLTWEEFEPLIGSPGSVSALLLRKARNNEFVTLPNPQA